MIHEYPEYYESFSCVGGVCKDSCCVGWELDIDEDTYRYYKSVEGDFGDRLRSCMQQGEDNTFVLAENDRCPFLNDDNLCDIYINLGEESLCKICTEYPRYSERVEGYMQSDLSLSCMEAGRIIFSETDPIQYVLKKEKNYYTGETDKLSKKLKALLEVRDTILGIIASVNGRIANNAKDGAANNTADNTAVSTEDITVNDTADSAGYDMMQVSGAVLKAAAEAQNYYSCEEYGKLHRFCKKLKSHGYDNKYIEGLFVDNHESLTGFDYIMSQWNEIYELLGGLEVIDDMWDKTLKTSHRYMAGCIKDSTGSKRYGFEKDVRQKYIREYVKILMYFIFRYMIRSYDDGNILANVKFAVFSYMVILALDYARWSENGGKFSMEDMIDVAHIYSKEVEHSSENVNFLLDEMLFFSL